jgi:hypothetical protein
VLAYHRELRAKRRRQRLARLFRPFRMGEFGGHAAIIPLIAACLAICLVGGALLSVATMSPASAPTLSGSGSSAGVGAPARNLMELPAGNVQLAGRTVPVRSLVASTIALVPANCDCGTELGRLAEQAAAAHVGLYFAGAGSVIAQLPTLTSRYGDGRAVAAADSDNVLTAAYHPAGLTALLVFKDAKAEVFRNLGMNFELSAMLRELNSPAASLSTD